MNNFRWGPYFCSERVEAPTLQRLGREEYVEYFTCTHPDHWSGGTILDDAIEGKDYSTGQVAVMEVTIALQAYVRAGGNLTEFAA